MKCDFYTVCHRLYSVYTLFQGNDRKMYTDLTSAKPHYSAGIDYSLYSRPIDLSTGPLYRRPSQRLDIDPASLAAVPGAPHRTYAIPEPPPPLPHQGGSHGTLPDSKPCRKTSKRPRDGDDQLTQKKKSDKQNTNKSSFNHIDFVMIIVIIIVYLFV